MSEWTPTTEQVRERFADAIEPTLPELGFHYSEAGPGFDRWLAGERAKAWAEGYEKGTDEPVCLFVGEPTRNPYEREEAPDGRGE